MKISWLIEYLSGINAVRVVLALAALAVAFSVKKFLLKKNLRFLAASAPFTAGVALRLIAALCAGCKGDFAEILREGFSVGATATVLCSVISGCVREPAAAKETLPDNLIAEGLLAGYVPEDRLQAAAEACAEILRAGLPPEEENAALQKAVLAAARDVTEPEAERLAALMQTLRDALR